MADTTPAPAKQEWRIGFPDTQSFLAIFSAISIIGLVYILALTGKTDTDTFKIMVGTVMGVGFTAIYQFYFGSSKGSTTKDNTIATMASNGAPAPTPPAS
jgi:hypothetical protein